jgi:hypothetical protein
MSINNKIIVIGFFVLLNTLSVAMEKTEPLAISSSASEQSLSGFYIPIPSFSDAYGAVASSLESFKNTVTNSISDDAAFKKLGWPLLDAIAQQELQTSKSLYKRVNEAIQNRTDYPTFLEDCGFINRRNLYCQRVLQALPTHPDAVNLALFCMQHHKSVMNDFDKSRFLLFVNVGQEKTKKGTQEIDLELAKLTIVPENNALLDNLFEQTVRTRARANKSVEKKENEEKNKGEK